MVACFKYQQTASGSHKYNPFYLISHTSLKNRKFGTYQHLYSVHTYSYTSISIKIALNCFALLASGAKGGKKAFLVLLTRCFCHKQKKNSKGKSTGPSVMSLPAVGMATVPAAVVMTSSGHSLHLRVNRHPSVPGRKKERTAMGRIQCDVTSRHLNDNCPVLVTSSPLVFGRGLAPLHHGDPGPGHLLGDRVRVELRDDGTVVGRDSAPRPIIRDPGIGQTLPHYPAVTCRGR